MFTVDCLTVFSPFNSNCYFIRREGERETYLVDPGGDAELILRFIADNKLQPKGIWLTHGHLDHLGAVAAVNQTLNVPVHIHALEKEWCSSAKLNGSQTFGLSYEPFEPTGLWQDADEFEALGSTWRILLTPGHSPGSVCIINREAKIAFSGDLILGGAVGRTDLPGGDEMILFHSLKRLFTEEKGLRLYPGHYDDSTMEVEAKHNAYVQFALKG
ncbi:MAG: MBL fold metallo-hydrolase [Sumerlaeia bacterium]